MSLELRMASPADALAIVFVFFDAFRDHPASRRVFPATSKHAQDYWIKDISAELRNPNVNIVLVTDRDSSPSGDVIAFAKWVKPRTASSAPSPLQLSWPEDADIAFADEFFGALDEKHSEIMGDRPHWYLEILGTRTAFQGRGAGKQLLRWGLKQADDEGVAAFLSASPWGAPLYEKHGFEVVETMTFDDGRYLETSMLREAKNDKT